MITNPYLRMSAERRLDFDYSDQNKHKKIYVMGLTFKRLDIASVIRNSADIVKPLWDDLFEKQKTNEKYFSFLDFLSSDFAKTKNNWKPWIEECNIVPAEWLPEVDIANIIVKDLCQEKTFCFKKNRHEITISDRIDIPQKYIDYFFLNDDMSDETVLEIFPSRTKSDIAIRRTRMKDIYKIYVLRGLKKLWLQVICLLFGLDIISVCNFLWWFLIVEEKSQEKMLSMNILKSINFETLYDALVKISLLVKWRNTNVRREDFIEIQSLTGYHNPPWEGFDIVEDTMNLAQSGTQHSLLWKETFSKVARKNLSIRQSTKIESEYQDWVMQGEWSTNGSSSMGRVEWSDNETSDSFKCRKNQVLDFVSQDEIKQTEFNATQVNISFSKPELGKIRIAVSSDLATYLQMTWITQFFNESYSHWPCASIDLDGYGETCLTRDFQILLSEYNSLPWDFAAFDHQPSLFEIVCILEIVINLAEVNVHDRSLIQYREISKRVIQAFGSATLSVYDKGQKIQYAVLGGVMSGYRWTSMIGNAWNTIVSIMAGTLVSYLGITQYDAFLAIRGDDSAWFACLPILMIIRIALRLLDIQGNDAKFRLMTSETEFLRRRISSTKVSAFIVRAIPGLTQRKPWNSEPKDQNSTLQQLISVVNTIERRGGNVKFLIKSMIQNWSVMNSSDTAVINIPTSLGGLGFLLHEFPSGNFKYRTKTIPKINFLNLTMWRKQKIEKEICDFEIKGKIGIEDLVSDEVRSTISPGDIVVASLQIQESSLFSFGFSLFGWKKLTFLDIPNYSIEELMTCLDPKKWTKCHRLFGIFRGQVREWQFYCKIAKYSEIHPHDIMSEKYVLWNVYLQELSVFGFRKSDCVSILLGDYISIPYENCNEHVSKFLCHKVHCIFFGIHKKRSKQQAWHEILQIMYVVEKQITQTYGYKMLFMN